MQLVDRVELCNGCGACRVACKYQCVKMKENEEGLIRPVKDENGCQKCNACMLFCPIYNPVELPEFETFYDSAEDVRKRRPVGCIGNDTAHRLFVLKSTI